MSSALAVLVGLAADVAGAPPLLAPVSPSATAAASFLLQEAGAQIPGSVVDTGGAGVIPDGDDGDDSDSEEEEEDAAIIAGFVTGAASSRTMLPASALVSGAAFVQDCLSYHKRIRRGVATRHRRALVDGDQRLAPVHLSQFLSVPLSSAQIFLSFSHSLLVSCGRIYFHNWSTRTGDNCPDPYKRSITDYLPATPKRNERSPEGKPLPKEKVIKYVHLLFGAVSTQAILWLLVIYRCSLTDCLCLQNADLMNFATKVPTGGGMVPRKHPPKHVFSTGRF